MLLAEQREQQVATANKHTEDMRVLLQAAQERLDDSHSRETVEELRQQLSEARSQQVQQSESDRITQLEERFKAEFAQFKESMHYECDQLRQQNDEKSEQVTA